LNMRQGRKQNPAMQSLAGGDGYDSYFDEGERNARKTVSSIFSKGPFYATLCLLGVAVLYCATSQNNFHPQQPVDDHVAGHVHYSPVTHQLHSVVDRIHSALSTRGTQTQSLMQTPTQTQAASNPEQEIMQKLSEISTHLNGHDQTLQNLQQINQRLQMQQMQQQMQQMQRQQLMQYPAGSVWPGVLAANQMAQPQPTQMLAAVPKDTSAADAKAKQHAEWARRMKGRMMGVEAKLDQLAEIRKNSVSEDELKEILGQVAHIENLVLKTKATQAAAAANGKQTMAAPPPIAAPKESLATAAVDKQFHVQSLMQVESPKKTAAATVKHSSKSKLDLVHVQSGATGITISNPGPISATHAAPVPVTVTDDALPAQVVSPATDVVPQPPATLPTIVNPPVHVCHDEVEYVGAGGAKYRTDCAAWNGAGYCSKDHEHYAYVSTHCPSTCGLCNGCFDNRSTESCQKWRSWGYCSALTCGDNCRYTSFVQRHCRQSCLLCTA